MTRTRIAGRTTSVGGTVRGDSRSLRERMAAIDWWPWAIVLLAALLRILLLGIKPPHFDEGINGWFVDQMTKNGFYKYDPTNYHGPLHFYILFVSQTLFGRGVWALRMPVVLGSIASVWLSVKFTPFVGRTAALIAALAMAVSPAFVFYGRYSIHEVWLLLFSMMFILGLLGLWQTGRPGYLWCAIMGTCGMILTKETYIIHLGCAAVAFPVAWVTQKIRRSDDAERTLQLWTAGQLTAAIAVALGLIIFFYSGNFMNWGGLRGLYETFGAWYKTGSQGNGHEKAWWYWLMLIGRYEPAVGLGLLACLGCLWFQRMSVRYLAIYGVGTLMAYSIVAYKTPWCIISVVWPMLFVLGAAIELFPTRLRRLALALAGLAIAASLVLSIRLNYFYCTTETEPYVYVQTYNDIYKLTKPLLELARRDPRNYQLVGHMVRPSAYPLPWILGDFTRVGYYEKDNLPSPVDAAFLVVQEDKIALVESKLHNSYYTMPFTIRPYQDTSRLYLDAKVFASFFPGKTPDFHGPVPMPAAAPSP